MARKTDSRVFNLDISENSFKVVKGNDVVIEITTLGVKTAGLAGNENEVFFNLAGFVPSNRLLEISYEAAGWKMDDSLQTISDGFYELTRKWTNISEKSQEAVFVFEALTGFEPKFFLIPSVNYNGNKWGSGKEPKGLVRDGKPWIFSYDRVSIPSATFSEDDRYSVGLFVSDEDEQSLTSSCSLFQTGSRLSHRLYWPNREEPVTYISRDEYGDAVRNMKNLSSGEHFSVKFYISIAEVAIPKTGWKNTFDRAHDILKKDIKPEYQPEKVWELGISYVKSKLFQKVGDYSLFRMGLLPGGKHVFAEPGMKWEYRDEYRYEIGWCGQNATFGNALLYDYIINGNKESLEIGISVLDTWEKYARQENGLFNTIFDNIQDNISEVEVDTCNLAWGAWQMMKAGQLAKKAGVERPAWIEMGLELCNFFTHHKAKDGGFGKQWRLDDGICTDAGGTVGCFIIIPMIEAYEVTGKPVYLDCAIQAFKFYAERDLNNMECTAGALDTHCVDKETCWPLLKTAIDLYEITGEGYYLQKAKIAGYYLLSWMFHYDVLYGSDTDFSKHGYRTYGATSVSTQHHHLDPWGALISLDWLRLYRHTGDIRWKERYYAAWSNCLLCLSDGSMAVRGMVRPAGAQNEGFWHCNWGFREDGRNKGSMNDWLVAWPGAFRLMTLMREKDWDVFR